MSILLFSKPNPEITETSCLLYLLQGFYLILVGSTQMFSSVSLALNVIFEEPYQNFLNKHITDYNTMLFVYTISMISGAYICVVADNICVLGIILYFSYYFACTYKECTMPQITLYVLFLCVLSFFLYKFLKVIFGVLWCLIFSYTGAISITISICSILLRSIKIDKVNMEYAVLFITVVSMLFQIQRKIRKEVKL